MKALFEEVLHHLLGLFFGCAWWHIRPEIESIMVGPFWQVEKPVAPESECPDQNGRHWHPCICDVIWIIGSRATKNVAASRHGAPWRLILIGRHPHGCGFKGERRLRVNSRSCHRNRDQELPSISTTVQVRHRLTFSFGNLWRARRDLAEQRFFTFLLVRMRKDVRMRSDGAMFRSSRPNFYFG